MHELLLHTTIPTTHHHQILSILAGIAAMQPVPVHEKHLIFKPLQQPALPGRPNQNQNQGVGAQMKPLQGQMHGDLFYLKVVGEMGGTSPRTQGGAGDGDGDETMKDVAEVQVEEVRDEEMVDGGEMKQENNLHNPLTANSSAPTSWTLQFRDLPDPSGRRPVTSRLMADIPITAGDPEKFMKAMEYSLISTYQTHGHRLTHNAIDIRVYQPLLPSSSANPTPLGPASYILQTSLKVQDGQNVALMQEGVRQLVELKEMLRGVVELEVGERLAVDTRVR